MVAACLKTALDMGVLEALTSVAEPRSATELAKITGADKLLIGMPKIYKYYTYNFNPRP